MDMELAVRASKAFPLQADGRPLYPATGHRQVLERLRQDFAAGHHLTCLIGAPGSGKTALLKALHAGLGADAALVLEPAPGALLHRLTRALGLDVRGDTATAARRRLAMTLTASGRYRRPVVLIIDDADRLQAADLDVLFHFFNPGCARILLAGRPVLATFFEHAQPRSTLPRADRIQRLDPLAPADTAGYIRHRLAQARLPTHLFDSDAAAAVHAYAGGLPRGINRLCAIVLMDAGRRGDDHVTAAQVRAVALRAPAGTYVEPRQPLPPPVATLRALKGEDRPDGALEQTAG
ncbi:MAG: ExeA family protein [Pseudomonadota bacterium]